MQREEDLRERQRQAQEGTRVRQEKEAKERAETMLRDKEARAAAYEERVRLVREKAPPSTLPAARVIRTTTVIRPPAAPVYAAPTSAAPVFAASPSSPGNWHAATPMAAASPPRHPLHRPRNLQRLRLLPSAC